jgi:hypothetical protein
VAACEHGFSPKILFLIGAFKAGVERILAGLRAKFLSSDSSRPCAAASAVCSPGIAAVHTSEREGFAEDSVNNASNPCCDRIGGHRHPAGFNYPLCPYQCALPLRRWESG